MTNPAPDQVLIEVAGQRIALTVDDGLAMRTLLLARLRESSLANKDDLLSLTQNAQPFLNTGALRISVWLLQTRGDKLILQYRMPSAGISTATFSAEVSRGNGGWQVRPVVPGHIHFRR